MLGMLGVLALGTYYLGWLPMLLLYVIPYWINVVWLDVVTYLHHHGPQDTNERIPWYRGEVLPCSLTGFHVSAHLVSLACEEIPVPQEYGTTACKRIFPWWH